MFEALCELYVCEITKCQHELGSHVCHYIVDLLWNTINFFCWFFDWPLIPTLPVMFYVVCWIYFCLALYPYLFFALSAFIDVNIPPTFDVLIYWKQFLLSTLFLLPKYMHVWTHTHTHMHTHTHTHKHTHTRSQGHVDTFAHLHSFCFCTIGVSCVVFFFLSCRKHPWGFMSTTSKKL